MPEMEKREGINEEIVKLKRGKWEDGQRKKYPEGETPKVVQWFRKYVKWVVMGLIWRGEEDYMPFDLLIILMKTMNRRHKRTSLVVVVGMNFFFKIN